MAAADEKLGNRIRKAKVEKLPAVIYVKHEHLMNDPGSYLVALETTENIVGVGERERLGMPDHRDDPVGEPGRLVRRPSRAQRQVALGPSRRRLGAGSDTQRWMADAECCFRVRGGTGGRDDLIATRSASRPVMSACWKP